LDGVKNITWLQTLLKELKFLDDEPTQLHYNNEIKIKFMNNLVFHVRMKHIEIQHHYIYKKVNAKGN
jgi:hypothetical protein